MGDASYAQSSFLGGELSSWAQGRFDSPRYKTALSLALNVLIVDEGAAPRRPGTQFLGTTYKGGQGRVIPFDFTAYAPYNLEFTDGLLRMWNGTQLVTTNDNQVIASISNTSPAVFTLSAAVAWATGDEAIFSFPSAPASAVLGAILLNRQVTLTMTTTTTFTCVDSVTGAAINGATINALTPTVSHVAHLATSYTVATADWHSLRAVQGLNISMFLHAQVAPQALQVLTQPTATKFAAFQLSTAFFQDGPYLDPPANAIATPNALTGNIQVVVGYTQWSNTTTYGANVAVTYAGQDYYSLVSNNTGNTPAVGSTKWATLVLGSSISSQGFVSTDVGRSMRLFSAPLAWSTATTYAIGNVVAYNGSYFTSLANSNTNNQPDISVTQWVINPSGAIYTWGVITAILSTNTVALQIYGSPLLYLTACPSFRIGAWSNTTGWPTCGCYMGGRFWFGGAIPNRFDASQPNAPFMMAPTTTDGTVLDSSAITYTVNSNSSDLFLWMEANSQGVLIGTKKGEYLISSGTAGGPITPSSIADSPLTRYGSANILPVKTGLTLCFVQRQQRRLLEFLNDTFNPSRFYGPDLTTNVRHFGVRQFAELAYQQEPAPIVWARMVDGSLIGTTYRRVTLFLNQEPEFNAWHQHTLGSARTVESICVGPSNGGGLDTLSLVTNDPASNVRYVESLTPLLDETEPLTSAWFLDAAVTPQAAAISGTNVIFYGLSYLNTRTVTVFAAGIDCGEYVVEGGSVTVPLGTVDPTSGYTFDTPQFDILQPKASTFAGMSVTITGGASNYAIPCVIGFNYQTRGQLCRPMLQADTGAKNGPGFAKKRSTSRYGINLSGSLGVRVGVDFTKTRPVPIASPMGYKPPYLSLYSGIVRDTLNDDFSFDSMLCWQTTRPYPATVTTFGGFIETQDV